MKATVKPSSHNSSMITMKKIENNQSRRWRRRTAPQTHLEQTGMLRWLWKKPGQLPTYGNLNQVPFCPPCSPRKLGLKGNWLCWRDFQLGAKLCESLQETIRNYRFVNPTDPKAPEVIWETNILPLCAYHSGASNSSHTAGLIGKRSEFWLAWILIHARLLTHFPRILCALICSSVRGEYARYSPYLYRCQLSNQCNQCRTHWL